MFYRLEVKDHIRVPPDRFEDSTEDSVLGEVRKKFEGYISPDLGVVIDVSKMIEIGEGVVIPEDGAAYYESTFELVSYKPEMQEVVHGKIKDITDFGAFISLGPIEGMIHISQTMDDFVSFSKEKVLNGKESKRTLKVGDLCRSRIIAVSYKDPSNPKLGLTMRQPLMGRLEWIEEDKDKAKEKKSGAKK